MPIVSISQGLSSDDLHVTALGCKTVEEADIILNHPQCAETTRQMVVAKIKLFDKRVQPSRRKLSQRHCRCG